MDAQARGAAPARTYYLLTITVPAELHGVFLRILKSYMPCSSPPWPSRLSRFAPVESPGGDPGFIATLHPWTRRMFFPPPHSHPDSGRGLEPRRLPIAASPR